MAGLDSLQAFSGWGSDSQGTADPCDLYKWQLPTEKRSSNITSTSLNSATYPLNTLYLRTPGTGPQSLQKNQLLLL